jgi:hypothetical protein
MQLLQQRNTQTTNEFEARAGHVPVHWLIKSIRIYANAQKMRRKYDPHL